MLVRLVIYSVGGHVVGTVARPVAPGRFGHSSVWLILSVNTSCSVGVLGTDSGVEYVQCYCLLSGHGLPHNQPSGSVGLRFTELLRERAVVRLVVRYGDRPVGRHVV